MADSRFTLSPGGSATRRKIAAKHYLMTTDADFDRAATENALPKALLGGTEKQRKGSAQLPEMQKPP